MKNVLSVAVIASVTSIMSMGSALAESADCACVAGEGTKGQIISASDRVSISGPKGPRSVGVGTPISSGSQIFVAPDASMNGQFGSNCKFAAGSGTRVSVSKLESGKLCLRVHQIEHSVPGSENAFPFPPPEGGYDRGDVIGLLTLIGGTAAFVLIKKDDDPSFAVSN